MNSIQLKQFQKIIGDSILLQSNKIYALKNHLDKGFLCQCDIGLRGPQGAVWQAQGGKASFPTALAFTLIEESDVNKLLKIRKQMKESDY